MAPSSVRRLLTYPLPFCLSFTRCVGPKSSESWTASSCKPSTRSRLLTSCIRRGTPLFLRSRFDGTEDALATGKWPALSGAGGLAFVVFTLLICACRRSHANHVVDQGVLRGDIPGRQHFELAYYSNAPSYLPLLLFAGRTGTDILAVWCAGCN